LKLICDSTLENPYKITTCLRKIELSLNLSYLFKTPNSTSKMPAIDSTSAPQPEPEPLTRLPFAPIQKSHILHCSYDYWYPKSESPSIFSPLL
jgi:hypothetical protein